MLYCLTAIDDTAKINQLYLAEQGMIPECVSGEGGRGGRTGGTGGWESYRDSVHVHIRPTASSVVYAL